MSARRVSAGWCLLGGVCPGGCLPRGLSAWGVSAWGGVWLGGVCPEGCLAGGVCPWGVCPGVCVPGVCLPRGGCLPRGVYTPGPRGRHPQPVNRITDRCKNITFPQLLLRTVKTGKGVNRKITSEIVPPGDSGLRTKIITPFLISYKVVEWSERDWVEEK